jgi:hypothetical protein
MSGPIAGVDEQQILPTIVVKIEESHTATHGFGQQLVAISPVDVREGNAGSGRDVGEFGYRDILGRANGECGEEDPRATDEDRRTCP